MNKSKMTDEEVLREIEALSNDPDVARGQLYYNQKRELDKQRQRLYRLRALAKKGRELREAEENGNSSDSSEQNNYI